VPRQAASELRQWRDTSVAEGALSGERARHSDDKSDRGERGSTNAPDDRRSIAEEDAIIDPLAWNVGADHEKAVVTLDSIRLLASSLGVNMAFGASSVSFGPPERHGMNDIFVSLAVAAGVTCPLTDSERSHRVILVTDLLLGRDELATSHISYCRQDG
jgi:hypothetical protein